MDNIIEEVTGSEYKYGFVTNVETDTIGKGLNEEVIRIISAKKEEPDWMLEFRLKAYRHWLTMKMPRWAQLDIPEINYQDIVYYAAPKQKETKSWEEVDPELYCHFNSCQCTGSTLPYGTDGIWRFMAFGCGWFL